MVLSVKPNFLTLTSYLMIIYWLFLGYFDRLFVTYIIGGLALSMVFDLIYVLLAMMSKVHTNRITDGYTVVVLIFMVVELALRIILIAKLIGWREPTQKQEYFEVYGEEVELKLRAGKKEHLIEKNTF